MTSSAHTAATKFKRVLWQRHEFDDNYTPPSFPYCVVFNEDARYRSFAYLLVHSLWILDHISLVILFFDVFLLCDNASISSSSLFAIDVLLVLFGLIVCFILLYVDEHTSSSSSVDTLSSFQDKIKRTYLIGILLIICCPFLRTLTESISTDTIWTMTILCAVVHVLTADYEFDKYKHTESDNRIQFSISSTYDPRITATVSLNAAVFMSVLLASRLQSNDLALSFLLFAFILFGGSLYVLRDLKLMNSLLDIGVSVLLCAVNYALICYQQSIIDGLSFVSVYCRQIFAWNMSALASDSDGQPVYDYQNDIRLRSLLYVYEYSIFVIVALGPIGFYRIQQYKVTIGGPWTYDTEGEASQYMVDSSNIHRKK